jgi:hypothetical protein
VRHLAPAIPRCDLYRPHAEQFYHGSLSSAWAPCASNRAPLSSGRSETAQEGAVPSMSLASVRAPPLYQPPSRRPSVAAANGRRMLPSCHAHQRGHRHTFTNHCAIPADCLWQQTKGRYCHRCHTHQHVATALFLRDGPKRLAGLSPLLSLIDTDAALLDPATAHYLGRGGSRQQTEWQISVT